MTRILTKPAAKRTAVIRSTLPHPSKLVSHIRELTVSYDFTERDLADILDVTPRSITRWKARDEKLSKQKIDRIDVLESILDLGKRVLGSETEVKHWLGSSVFSLEGQKPMELIKTESGRRRVENVLLQIEGGVY